VAAHLMEYSASSLLQSDLAPGERSFWVMVTMLPPPFLAPDTLPRCSSPLTSTSATGQSGLGQGNPAVGYRVQARLSRSWPCSCCGCPIFIGTGFVQVSAAEVNWFDQLKKAGHPCRCQESPARGRQLRPSVRKLQLGR